LNILLLLSFIDESPLMTICPLLLIPIFDIGLLPKHASNLLS
jgi:hypothetical protein